MGLTSIKQFLSKTILDALRGSNSPSASNPFATMNDVGGADTVKVDALDDTAGYLEDKLLDTSDAFYLKSVNPNKKLTINIREQIKPWTSISDPTVTDDDTVFETGSIPRYRIGQTWVNITTGDSFICKDLSTGAAVWDKTIGINNIGNIIVDTTTISASHTGDLLETVIGVLTIPANTFKNGDWFNFMSLASVDTDAVHNRFYINTAPLLDGNQQQLLYYNQTSSINIKLFADFLIYNNTLIGWKRATANSTTVYGNHVGAGPDIPIDFTVTQYLLYTCQLAINTKIFTLKGMYLERKRKI